MSSFSSGRRIEPDPLSDLSLLRLKQRIHECDTTHQNCRRDTNPLPTRVVDLGPEISVTFDSHRSVTADQNSVKVIESEGLHADYVALSHCWGQESSFKTTKETYPLRKQSMSLKEMPETFRDAILMTRNLGIQYLWIDSLCIIQDDIGDWERESAKMVDVYSKSYFTLAASNADGDSKGFLHTRFVPEIIFFKLALKNGGECQVSFQPGTENEQYDQRLGAPVNKEPLTSRAWVIQERYLSRRIVLFATGQTFWECQESCISENGDRSRESRYCISRLISSFGELQTDIEDLSLEYRGITPQGTKYTYWYQLLSLYSQCSLTNGDDKLPAVSGLASLLAKATGDRYCAGIWLNDYTRSLLWTRLAPRRPDNGSLDLKIAEPYRAPSFSWASVDGAITWSPYCDRKDFEDLALLKDCQCSVIGANPFGRVLNCRLLLEAPLTLITKIRQDRWHSALTIDLKGTEGLGAGGLDQADNDIPADGRLEGTKAAGCMYVLGLAFTGILKMGDFHIVGMIVRRTGYESSEFRRVGHAHLPVSAAIEYLPECKGMSYDSPERKQIAYDWYGLHDRVALALI